jgi:phosphopantothenoylcysteine decarboxylase / phosphopantothenate---cysteine ligase
MKIALGVSACIGAYKAILILRHLQELSVDTEIIMTKHAQEFIQPLTFQALSTHPVITDMFAPTERSDIYHISLAQAIDLLVIAPATANIIAKLAHGIADDFLTTLYLSTPAPTLIAPAMNVEMWRHAATQENIKILSDRGVKFINPEAGYLACGMKGEGRLADPLEIAQKAVQIIQENKAKSSIVKTDLVDEHILITAGPTREYIDPVRFISNRSSGKMGYAIAQAAIERGAKVTLVSGPVSIAPPDQANLIKISTTEEMYKAVMDNFDNATIVIKSAAVCDYRPSVISNQKIKKTSSEMSIELERTQDILAALGERKTSQVLVGFAAETQNLIEYAQDKLERKNLDLIVANDVNALDAGFDSDSNRVTMIDRDSNKVELPLMPKREVADYILDAAIRLKKLS